MEFGAGVDVGEGFVHVGASAALGAELVDGAAAGGGVGLAVGAEDLAGFVVEGPEGHGESGAEADFGEEDDAVEGGVEVFALHGAGDVEGEDDEGVEAGVVLAAAPDFVVEAGVGLGLHGEADVQAVAAVAVVLEFVAGVGGEKVEEFVGEAVDEGGEFALAGEVVRALRGAGWAGLGAALLAGLAGAGDALVEGSCNGEAVGVCGGGDAVAALAFVDGDEAFPDGEDFFVEDGEHALLGVEGFAGGGAADCGGGMAGGLLGDGGAGFLEGLGDEGMGSGGELAGVGGLEESAQELDLEAGGPGFVEDGTGDEAVRGVEPGRAAGEGF